MKLVEKRKGKLLTLIEFIAGSYKIAEVEIYHIKIIPIWIVGIGDDELGFFLVSQEVSALLQIVDGDRWDKARFGYK